MKSSLLRQGPLMLRQKLGDSIVSAFERVGAMPRRVRQLVVALLDGILCIVAVWIAFSLRLGEFYRIEASFVLVSVAALALWYPIAVWRGIYRSIIRFSGARAMVRLGTAVIVYTIPMSALFLANSFA